MLLSVNFPLSNPWERYSHLFSDKTGTITQNAMTVHKMVVGSGDLGLPVRDITLSRSASSVKMKRG